MKGSKFSALWSILLGGFLPLILFLACKSLVPDWKGVHEPLHSVFETVGLFAGLFVAVLLLQQQDQKKDGSHYISILSALIAMAILDGFHASVRLGNSFVWLHSVAVLAGGFLFSMVWIPPRATQSHMAGRLAGFVAAAAIALGLFSLVFPEALPLLIVEGNFTIAASTINVLGGILFVVAGMFFIVRYWTNRETEEILFAFFCFLNASAALSFPFGHVWGIDWWLWHLLRLVAYLILLGYVFIILRGTELKRKMADELRVASLYARSLIEASLDPLVTISSDGKITDVNKTTEQATGVSRERLIGTDFADYFTEPDKAREGYKQVFSHGTVKDYPLTIRHSSGKITDVLYNASVYKNEIGEVQGVFAAARDVTESKRLTSELTKMKTFLDNILQSSTKYSIIGKDLNHSILSWNEGARRNYGYSSEEILGKDSKILHSPEDIKSGAAERLLATAYSKGIAEDELQRVRKDGSRFWASVVVTRRDDASGQPIGYLLMSSDISERKQAEAQVRSASQYARNLIEASLDPLVTISSDGKITDVNKTTEQVTGVSRERLIGSDFADYFTEPDKARAGYKQVFSQGTVKDYPLTIRHSSGRNTDVLYNASVYRNEAGEVQGVFAAARDITERKRIDEELKKYREQLEEMVKQRTAALTDVLSKVKDTVNVLAASSSEIMAATTQVASSTAENATAISETTTTVEEARQAAQLSSEKARNVSGSAQRVDEVSRTGQKAVVETASGMRHIHDQMESIAQTIVRLSEQSQSIGGIIASVTDLADQSNLLAVNAAIEAAKAGEQGKGFAVVAQEIKSLAEQSKQATAQVRSILSDVQKATSAAVMATERGSKAVEAGVKQSEQAGEAIRVLAESSQEAVQTAMQIVASSQQQMVGMDQIGTAMKNINQAGAQNAASVRQAETAAKNLHELGLRLKELVDQFKV